MANKPITARRHIFLSQLDPKAIQREVMNDDSGWEKFAVKLNALVAIPDISETITMAQVDRTIEGASTLTLDINDYYRKLLKSDMLREKLDIEVDGLWFRLTSIDKAGDNLTLTFQDREIEILRTYKSWKIANRDDMTRAEFVLSMIREVKEYNIPVVIPELHKVQPIETYPNSNVGAETITFKNGGIPKDINKAADQHHHRESVEQYKSSPGRLTVKGAIATETQIGNANIILAVADQLGVSRRLKVISMMVAITETLIKNNPGGPAAHNTKNDAKGDDSAGVFQQRPDWGPYLDRTDVETSARMFFNGSNGIPGAIQIEKEHTDDPYWVIAADIQHPDPRYDARYALYRTEAEKFVNAYGDVGNVDLANSQNTNQNTYSNPKGTYYFYRGEIADKRGKPVRRPENSWKCIQRLAGDVDWRGFFVSGTFYFISEVDLLKQLPLAIINEFTPGIESFNGSYNRHAKNGTIEIEAIAGAWSVPPGGVVLVKDVGHPFDGRWIVSSYTRDLVGANKKANISLKKPRPALPEVKDDPNASTLAGWVPKIEPVAFTGTNAIDAVLNNKNITFASTNQSSDVRLGAIYEPVLQFLLWLAGQGYPIRVSSLKTGHPLLTTDNNPSAHAVGKAVDIDKIGETVVAANDVTGRVMDLIALYQVQLQFDQLIGPFPDKCLGGPYPAHTLYEHRNHIHVGWPL